MLRMGWASEAPTRRMLHSGAMLRMGRATEGAPKEPCITTGIGTLDFARLRQDDPTLGRYTQPDPLGFVDGASVYGYAGSNSISFVDADGRWVQIVIGGIIGGGLEYLLNPCADLQDILVSTSLGAAGAGVGSFTMIKRAGTEFSHFIPKRLLPPFMKTTKLNGNYVTPLFHSQTDPFRLLKLQKKWGEQLYPPGIRQLLRIPAWVPGGAAGAAAGVLTSQCDCSK